MKLQHTRSIYTAFLLLSALAGNGLKTAAQCTSPVVNSIPNQAVCSGVNTTAVSFSGTNASQYIWGNNTPSIGLGAAGTGDIPSFAGINSGSTPVVATVTVTPVNNNAAFAYVPNFGSNNVSVINLGTNTVVSTITAGSGPYAAACSPDGSKVYVTNTGSNTVSVISTGSNTVIATINVGAAPKGIIINASGTTVYVANYGSGNVSAINTATNAVTTITNVTANAQSMTFSGDGSSLYVGSFGRSFTRINTATNTAVSTSSWVIGGDAVSIAIGADGVKLFMPEPNTSQVLQTSQGGALNFINGIDSAQGIRLRPGSTEMWVARKNGITIINSGNNAVTNNISLTGILSGISFSSDGSFAYVTNTSNGTVSVINTFSKTIVGSATGVGSNPIAYGNFISGNSCTGTPATFTITVNPKPAVFNVTGGGTYCAGGGGVAIGLSGSQTGVNYQLKNGTADIGSPVPGTGSAISFGNQTAAGTYTVAATSTSNCANNMNNSALVTINSLPTVNATSNSPVTVGATLTLTGSGATTYSWTGPNSFSASSNPASIANVTLARAGTYTVTGTSNGCSAIATTTVSILQGPAGVNSGILAWLDASDINADENAGNNPANATAIPTWDDRSGNNNDGLQLGGAGTLRSDPASLINSHPVVRFAGGQVYNFANIDIRAEATPDLSVITVYKLNGQGHEGLWGNDNGNWDRFMIASFSVVGNNNGIASHGPNQSPPYTQINNSGVVGNLYLFTAMYDGEVTGGVNNGPVDGSSFWFNGSLLGTFTDKTETVNAQPTLRLGLDGDDGLLDGDIAEFIVYNRKLTDCEIQQINVYLSNKYGVTYSTAAITPGGPTTFCQGQSVVLAASTGTGYQWKLNGNIIGGAANQTYTATQAGSYTVDVSSGCGIAVSAPVVVTVNPVPTVNAISNQVVCNGTSTVAANFSGAVSGTTFSWTNNNISIGLAASGTGDIASFTAMNTGTSPVVATITVTPSANGCTGIPQTFTITVNPTPTAFDLTGGGAYCTGGGGMPVGLSGSETGVNYQLKINGVNTGSPVPGTGNAISFGNQPAAGTFTAVATSAAGCTNNMNGSAAVTVNPLPTAFNVTGGGTFCEGGSGMPVGLSGSQTGMEYTLIVNNNDVKHVNGTGNAINFGNYVDAGTYTVFATDLNTNCFTQMPGSATIIVNPLPDVYTVTGGGAYCSGGAGMPIGLDGSQTGINYQLKNGAINVGSPMPGTGNALSFGNQTVGGTYTVVATNATTNCTANMDGDAVITVNPLPSTPVITATGSTSFCDGGSVLLSTDGINQTAMYTEFPSNNTQTVCDCPPGYVAVGYQGRTGGAIDQFQLACKQLNANGTLGSTIVYTSQNGNSGGGNFNGPHLFSGNTVLVGADIRSFGGNFSSFEGKGQTIVYISGNGNNMSSPTSLTAMNAANPGNTGSLYVPDGNVIVGMAGLNSTFASGVAFRYKPVSAVASSAGYSYIWSNSGTGNSILVDNSGSFTVTVTDANGCSATSAPTTTTENALPIVTIAATGPTTVCQGTQVPLTATATAGSGTISQYEWLVNNSPFPPTQNNTFNAFVTANWGVRATNSNGCTAVSNMIPVTIDQPLVFTTCPSNETTTANTATCNAAVTYNATVTGTPTPAITYAFAGATTGNGSGTGSGSLFNIGVTTVTVSATSNSCGPVTCTFTITVNAPEINVTGNSNLIADGDNTPSAADHTDFGGTNPGIPVSKTYTINNTGTSALTVSSVDMTGMDASSFTVSGMSFPATIPVSGSATFTVTFNATALGIKNAVVNVNSDDCDEGLYDFAVTGEITCAPGIFTICPANISTSAAQGLCNAVVNYTATVTGTPAPAVSYAFTGATTGNGSGTGSGAAFNVGVTTVVITAVNPCSNPVCTFTVTVNDDEAPVVTCPANVTVSCDASTATSATGSAAATDNCGIGSISNTDVSTQDADANNAGHYNYTISRTWKATDVHDNFSTCVQTITVQDVTNPQITVPASVTINCQDATTPAANGTATGTDNCSPVAITYTDVSTQDANANNAGNYNYTITRTWKAMDVTGNFATGVQTIAVQDVTNPAITVPANVTINCQDATTPAANGTATGTDNCSPVAISYTDVSTQDANANNAGNYNYTITRTWKAMDVTGNYATGVQAITVQDIANPAITIPANVTVNCQDDKAPAANGTATGSDNCSPVTISYTDVTTQDANANNAGNYNYTIARTWKAVDVTGNYTTGVQTITVQDITSPVITCPSDKTVSCKTSVADNGSATATDNCSPVTITSSDVSTQDANPANSGYYNYTITRTWKAADVSGNFSTCAQTITVHALNNANIVMSPNPTVSGQAMNTIYPGYGPQSATLTASALNGVGTLSYSWSPATGLGNPNSAATSASPLVTTTYTVTITDGTGCSIQKSFTIYVHDVHTNNNKVAICHNGNSLSVSVNAVPAHLAHGDYLGECLDIDGYVANVGCNGGNNGAVNATVTGGLQPYGYSWNNSATTQDLSNIPAGTYTLTVTTANGRTDNKAFTVTQPPVLAANGTVKGACYGQNNGSINQAVTGGTSPYSYAWSGSSSASQDRSNLAAGTYICTITDSKGCSIGKTYTLTQPLSVISVTAVVTHVSCKNGDNGAIDMTVTGGTPPYTYDWNGCNITTQDRYNLEAGTYSVEITDSGGCTKTVSFTITEPSSSLSAGISVNPQVTVQNGQPYTIYLGYGLQSVTLTAAASGGMAPYTYSWSGSVIGGSTTQSVSVSPTVDKTYTLTVTDAKGCTKIVTRTINVVNLWTSNDKIRLCHYGNTISVYPNQVAGHLAHGDMPGDCSGYGCNKPKESNDQPEEAGLAADYNTSLVWNEVKVYPNPNQGSFYIELPVGVAKADIIITDVDGRLIAKKAGVAGQKISFDLGNVARGYYIVHVITNTYTHRSRISVQ